MHEKLEINLTKIKGSCQLGRKVVTHNSKSDLPLENNYKYSNATQIPKSISCKNNFYFRCYSDLADRKKCREGTWYNEGWNDVVANTVPLIRSMKTRILEPLPFSPTQ